MPYDTASNRQKLDVYLPKGEGPFPVIINIHGGGFMSGHKSWEGTTAVVNSAMPRGYAVVSINYRLSDEAIFPAAVEDVFSAIRHIKDNAKLYRLDANRIAAWGASAGGNLAVMAATRGNVEDGTDIQAAITMFAPLAFDHMDEQIAELNLVRTPVNHPASIYSDYVGAEVGTREAAGAVFAADPMSYITPDDPPVFIQHGLADNHVPPQQSQMLASALIPVIGEENVELKFFEGAGHGGGVFETDENLNKIYNFLDRHLNRGNAQAFYAAD